MPNESLVPEGVSDLLSPSELGEYTRWLEKSKPPIAISTSLRMFEAFLNGASCEEIARLNQGFEVGAIIQARLRDKWDDKLARHRAELFEQTRQRVMQIQMEAIGFTADQLAAAHKRDGDKIKRFMMTGNPADLDEASYIGGIKSYKDMISVLLALTGQDKTKQPAPGSPMGVQVAVTSKSDGSTTVDAVFSERPPTEAQAERLLAALEAQAGVKNE